MSAQSGKTMARENFCTLRQCALPPAPEDVPGAAKTACQSGCPRPWLAALDRKRVVSGKNVSVSVDLGRRRIITRHYVSLHPLATPLKQAHHYVLYGTILFQ